MTQPQIKTDIEARVKDTGDIMTGALSLTKGHLYLEGAVANSSSSNTTQLVFGTSSNNHVAISSNTNALVINKDVKTTSPQIVLYIESPSKFPYGIDCGPITGSGALTIAGATNLNGSVKLGDAASDAITINGTPTFNADINVAKNLTIAGTLTANGNVILGSDTADTTTVKSNLKITNNIASTSKTTGAIIVTGGIGASGQINAQSFRIDEVVKFVYNNTDKCLDIIFD